MPNDLGDLTDDVAARVAALGFDLADLRQAGSKRRTRLEVRIDRPAATPGHGVTVDDCAIVSRALEHWLDESGLLGPNYILEVSSPGIERPIRWPRHWTRFVGHDVSVRLAGRGRLRATIVGLTPDYAAVMLRPLGEATDLTVPLADARDAKLVVDWERIG